jgi:hypothetical protein
LAEIEIKPIRRHIAEIGIRSTAPLIVKRFDEKAKQQMLDSMQGRKTPKESRDPQADYERACHRLPDGGYGFPAAGFKAATVGAARFFQDKKLSMTLLKQALVFRGEGPDALVRLDAPEPKMREDYVRLGLSGTDLRYRPMFDPWRVVLRVVFLPSLLSVESVVALVGAGGMGGVGEWRPASKISATGVYGTYEIDTDVQINEIKEN